MLLRSLECIMLTAVVFPALAFAGSQKQCISAEEATKRLQKDICLAAHVYDVVEIPDGTRYLDVCAPETPDEKCRFTIVSLNEDRDQVGELSKYRDSEVQVRGIVQSMHGRAGIVLSHARQFYGGKPRFRPNSKLLRGFNAEQSRPPLSDPNLRSQGGRRAFRDTKDKIALSAK
jgi:hypothetical protein